MNCAIVQPHYFPWLGYFDMIHKSDIFVFLDDVKFINREWKNRNKIRLGNDYSWLTVPIKKNTKDLIINKVEISYDFSWQKDHLNKIKNSYLKSPNYYYIFSFISELISNEYQFLSDLNINLIKKIYKFIYDKEKIFIKSSDLHISGSKDLKLLNICKELEVTSYLANNKTMEYLDVEIFKKNKIEVNPQNYNHKIYDQFYNNKKLNFISYLSVIDYLMNAHKKNTYK